MTRNVWAMQDDFDSTTDPAEQERLRQEMRDNGYRGVADTIGKTDGQS